MAYKFSQIGKPDKRIQETATLAVEQGVKGMEP
jgi:hypothetical protein